MNILYLHQYFTFPNQAGGTRSYDLAKGFVEQGHSVTMITSNAKMKDICFTKRWTYLEREGIKFWILNCTYNQKMNVFKRIGAFLKYMFFSSVKIIGLKGDLILATSTPLTIAVPALIKKRISRLPFIFEVRDVWPEVPIKLGYIRNRLLIVLLRKFEAYTYKNSDFIVALSVGMRDNIIRRIPDVDNLKIIPNICEINRFKNVRESVTFTHLPVNKKIILYAGTLGYVNDISYVARLAKWVREIDENIIFLIIGQGSEKEQIVEWCRNNNILNHNIWFETPISKDSLSYVYSISHMGSSFVRDVEILWDNSANKFFDTLAAGKPMLINHEGWQAEFIRKENCGYVLPSKLNKKDVIKFVEYLNNEDLQTFHSENAIKAAQYFSLEKAINKYGEIFRKII